MQSQVTGFEFTFLRNLYLAVNWEQRQNVHNYFTLVRSRDVNGHVTIRLSVPHFLFDFHCDQSPMSSPFEDIAP